MQIVKFRCSPSILLGVTEMQTNGVVVSHVVSVGPFPRDPGRSVIVLDATSAQQGPLSVVVDGPPEWVIDQLGLPVKDATNAPGVREQMPERVLLPERNGGAMVRPLERIGN